MADIECTKVYKDGVLSVKFPRIGAIQDSLDSLAEEKFDWDDAYLDALGMEDKAELNRWLSLTREQRLKEAGYDVHKEGAD